LLTMEAIWALAACGEIKKTCSSHLLSFPYGLMCLFLL
jgi:hypothetical protein